MITANDIQLFKEQMNRAELENLSNRYSNRVELEKKLYEAEEKVKEKEAAMSR